MGEACAETRARGQDEGRGTRCLAERGADRGRSSGSGLTAILPRAAGPSRWGGHLQSCCGKRVPGQQPSAQLAKIQLLLNRLLPVVNRRVDDATDCRDNGGRWGRRHGLQHVQARAHVQGHQPGLSAPPWGVRCLCAAHSSIPAQRPRELADPGMHWQNLGETGVKQANPGSQRQPTCEHSADDGAEAGEEGEEGEAALLEAHLPVDGQQGGRSTSMGQESVGGNHLHRTQPPKTRMQGRLKGGSAGCSLVPSPSAAGPPLQARKVQVRWPHRQGSPGIWSAGAHSRRPGHRASRHTLMGERS